MHEFLKQDSEATNLLIYNLYDRFPSPNTAKNRR